jgi:hypothetical protein
MLVATAQENKSKIDLTTPVERIYYEPLTTLKVGEAVLVHPMATDSLDLANVHLICDQAEANREGDDFVVIAKQAGEITLRFYDYSIIEKPVLVETKTLMAIADFSYFPKASLNGKTSGHITHSELLHADELKMLNLSKDKMLEEFSSLRITGFKMSIFAKGKDPVLDILSDGTKLTPEMKGWIKDSPKGAKVYFEYIKAVLNSSSSQTTRSLPPLVFVLVDD